MASSELVTTALHVELVDRDLYQANPLDLWKPRSGTGVFGGQIIAQATWAATLALRRDEGNGDKGVHSVHAYFLSFGNAALPILYRVERLRDGRSYSTRTVLATQDGRPIFTLTCSFSLPEPRQTLIRQLSVPGGIGSVPLPEDCKPTEERLQDILDGNATARPLSKRLKEYIQGIADERRQSSIEMRSTDPTDIGGIVSDRKGGEPSLIWFRSRAKVAHDPAFQKCVIAYASDLSFIGTAARAAGLSSRTTPSLGMLASLDHALYFYDDTVDVSEWLLFYMEAPIVRGGRGLVTGRIYKRDGTLAVVIQQEGVVRAAL